MQYLLNATAIWLLSLISFDVLLRRESYHAYNRFYLVFTLLLGALLPLWQWQDHSHLYNDTLAQPLRQVVAVKQGIVTSATAHRAIGWQQWLLITYLAGVVVALGLLLADVWKLLLFYRVGKRSRLGGWTIIETGRDHAPFSFRHTLFAGSRQQYSEQEWDMILGHEGRHTSLFHFLDLLLLQVARVVFWFHPLVYAYNNRVLLVHEYQADNAATRHQRIYGQFLIAQAMLGSSPGLTHSFNRSPIKKRILMLTRTSTSAARTKVLVFIPLVMICLVCFSRNSFSQKPAGKKAPVVKLSSIDTGIHIANYQQVMANPRLVCADPGCKVTKFTFSMLGVDDEKKDPKDRSTYWGPFVTEGNELNDAMKKVMEKYKNSKGRIFIEEIHVDCKGEDKLAGAIIYKWNG